MPSYAMPPFNRIQVGAIVWIGNRAANVRIWYKLIANRVRAAMTFFEFNALSDEDQMQCWTQRSRFSMTRHVEQFAVNVCAINSFFFEVWSRI